MIPLAFIAALIGGYLLGSIPFGLVLTRAAGLGDIREIGSGNIGATNVLRTGRKDLALATLLLDAGKAGAALLIARALAPADSDLRMTLGFVAGFAAFIGHCYPAWLGFKGGKGVATFFGLLFAGIWPLGLLAGVTWLAIAAIFRFSSLAALCAAAIAPLAALAGGFSAEEIVFTALLGAIIFSPDLVSGLPALGKNPEYLDITRKTNIPMIILQGGLRSSAAQFLRMLQELWSNNHNVYYSMLPGIAGMFYRDEPNAETLAKLKALPGEMPLYFRLLEATPWHISKGSYVQPREAAKVSLDIKLRAFQGNPQPLPIQLKDVSGRTLKLEDYRGKVTVVNFWATWCPPCVEEIPSLNRLREEMQGEAFELISINFAETPKTVNEFMKRVNVEFPVLIDPSGKVSQQWNVIGFPSTFVIGKDGKIKYGVNAAIHWDAPEVIEALKALSK